VKKIWRRFESFLFFDYKGIERHLEKMALAGWVLHSIPIFYWEYHKAEPKKLRYAVTYLPKPSFPYPTEDQQVFYDSCRDAGWELAAQRGQMQIFRAAKANPAPIEADEAEKLRAVHRIMRKDFLPGNVLGLLLTFVQLYLLFSKIVKDPIRQLSNASLPFVAAFWALLAVQICVLLITYTVWYRKSKKSVERDGTQAERFNGRAYRFLQFLTATSIALAVLTFIWQHFGFARALGVFSVIAVLFLLHFAVITLKWGESSRLASPKVTAGTLVAASVLLTCAATFYITGEVRAGRVGVDTYTYTTPEGYTYTRDIYHDPLPLRVEDMMDADYDRYSYRWTADTTFLLAHYVGSQSAKLDGNIAPEIYYTITDVKLPALFDLCLSDSLEVTHHYFIEPDKAPKVFRMTDDPLWQADAVYRLYQGEDAMEDYILCWGSRIVYISFDFSPTPAQIAVAAQKLRA